MKILFTADWHIKLGQKNVPIEWSKNRYYGLFSKIYELEKQVDILIIGGDIFDKLPTMDELELYYDFISGVSKPTYIYSGNHEALKKDTTFLSNLRKVSSLVNKNVEIIDEYATIDGIDFIPYNRLKDWAKDPTVFNGSSRILCTHVRGEIPPHVKSEIDLELFKRWEVVLAGDLHSYDNCQLNILYPGSPVTTSFHRSSVNTGAIIFDTVDFKHSWVVFDLPQLIRKTIKAGEPMPATEYHHTIYEVEGDMVELSAMDNHELLDKKVVKRDVDTALILDPTMTLAEEVEEYLRYVLQLNDDSVEKVLREFNNHIGKIQHD